VHEPTQHSPYGPSSGASSGPWSAAASHPAVPGSQNLTGALTPIRSVRSVRTLLEACGDHRMTHLLCQAATSYEELASLTLPELAGRLGAWAAQMHLSATPLGEPNSPGLVHLTRYDPSYPSCLGELDDPPVLIQVAGKLPVAATVTIGGTQRPTAGGRAAARAAAQAAGTLGAGVVGVVDGGCGQAALTQAVADRVPAVAITPYRLDRPGVDDLLVGQVLAAGGAAVSVYAAAGEEVEVRLRCASRLSAAWSRVTVLAELGVYAGGGVVLARTAVGLGRYLVVPDPRAELDTLVESSGVAVLGRARRFSAEWFGSSERIAARVAAGRPAADAVVGTYQQLLDALAWGLGTAGPDGTARSPQGS
jgi:hypothetical protein